MVWAIAAGEMRVAFILFLAAGLSDGADAILLEKAKSPQLYNAVRELILDSDLQSRLSQQAMRAVQHLRWKDAIAKLSSTYIHWCSRLFEKRVVFS